MNSGPLSLAKITIVSSRIPIEILPNDVGGIAVHVAARVAQLAGAGEVLTSSVLKDLVAGSGLSFEDRGMHSLKGLTDEMRIFAAGTPAVM